MKRPQQQMSDRIVLSHMHVAPLLKAHQEGRGVATTSLDLGLSEVEVVIDRDSVILSGDVSLSLEALTGIAQDRNSCYLIGKSHLRKIQAFSEYTNLLYSLLPTDSAPTLMISGFPMHRIKGTNPWLDSRSKIQAIGRVSDQVLDTCTGLGYTAILAARKASSVVTVEVDPVVLELARLNPWSDELFSKHQIDQVVGDVVEEIEGFGDDTFSCVIHDPPTIGLAGDLYSGAFYRELHRVLRPRGKLFHYTGDSSSKLGRNTARGVAQRLREVGFRKVKPREEAFGLVGYKGRRRGDAGR
jgi:predicted methyltransferase